MDSPSQVQLTRAELDDASLRTIAASLHATELLTQLKARLDASGMSAVAVGDQKFALTAARPGTSTAASGLIVQNATSVTAVVNDASAFEVRGLTLGSAQHAPVALASLAFSDTNVMDWSGDTESVTRAPLKFLLPQILGVDVDGVAGAGLPKYADLVPLLAPLHEWLASGTRNVEMGADGLAQLAAHLPDLADDDATGHTIRALLQKISHVQSNEISRRDKLLQVEATGEMECEAALGDVKLATSYGIESVTPLSPTSVSVVVYGIRARPKTGLIRPWISLSRIDLEPKQMTVRNVPVLGSYTVDMSDPNSLELTCD